MRERAEVTLKSASNLNAKSTFAGPVSPYFKASDFEFAYA